MSGWMSELRDEIAKAYAWEVDAEDFCTYGERDWKREASLRFADAILSLPRIKKALKALEEQEAMDRKLGHSAKC